MEITKILWPTDLSENAAQALPLVTSLSEKYQAEVHVLYVLEALGNFGAWYGDFDQSEVQKLQRMEKERAESKLEEICQGSLYGCPLYIRHTAIGDPASEILKLADKEKPDLIIMATRGRQGHFQFGSVAERLVKHAQVPVLTIPVKGSV
jgi:nucleotide-binding universal stress UspA family protein